MSAQRIVGIVLAGGASTRFGGDKLGATLEGRPLLHHAAEAVGAVAGHVIVVIAPGAAEPTLPPSLAGRTSVARDAVPGAGPLQGLAAGLGALPEGDPPVVLVAGGDMPTLHTGVLGLLAATLATDPTIVALTLEDAGGSPLPMAVRPAALPAILDLLARDRRSLRALLDSVPRAVLPAATWRAVDPAGATLRDIDSPADLGGPGAS